MATEQLKFCRRCKKTFDELDLQQPKIDGVVAYCVPCNAYLTKMISKWKDKFAQMKF